MLHLIKVLKELKVASCKSFNKSDKGFTLVELLVVIGILAALATAVVVVINPMEMLRQGRDAIRMEEIGMLHKALSLFQVDRPTDSMGIANRIYVSIPDTSSTCANLGLPALPTGWSYHCVTATNLRNTNGTGWIPINFTTMFQGSPFASLPVDPINTVALGAFYVFVTDGRTWSLASLLESEKYTPSALRDGGTDFTRFEAGNNLALWTTASGLVGYWSFDNPTLGTGGIRDSALNNHGTLHNATLAEAQVPGVVGGALRFDGVNDIVDVPDSASLNIINAITVEAWVRTTVSSTDFNSAIVNKGNNAYFLTIGEYVMAEPRVTGFLFIAGTWRFLRGNTPINDGSWHHVVMTYDGQRLMVYRNGISDAPPLSVTGNITIDTRVLRIGTYRGITLFNGNIDEVRIYNRALSATEIMANFNATK